MPRPTVLAFVLAGGEGRRLRPLTRYVSKPALPFGPRHRIIDFVLSNLVNSGLRDVHVLVQYQGDSLIRYIRRAWSPRPEDVAGGAMIQPVRARGPRGYQGTIDAIAQNLGLIDRLRPDVVAVFSADHVYRMDVRQMLDTHLHHSADVTVATIAVPKEQACYFGVVETDDVLRVTRFREKPSSADGMPGRGTHVRASMGNYLFGGDVLREQLHLAHERAFTDFGAHLLPELTRTHRLMAYDFVSNEVPGLRPHEEVGYWRDVGTIDSYFDAHLDTLGPLPRFELDNPHWPVRGAVDVAPAAASRRASARRSSVHAIDDAARTRAMLHGNVRLDSGAVVEASIVLGRARIGAGARIRSAIIDAGCVIPAGETIGHDPERDRRRFTVSSRGVVVVPRGYCRVAGSRPVDAALEVA